MGAVMRPKADPMTDRGHLFVVSAPSGAGKSTLCNAVRERFPDIHYSVSATTRPPRPGETDGVDYHFVTEAEFQEGIERGRWAEWAVVHGNYYGTSAEGLREALESGTDILLDIDVQGAKQIVERFPEAVTIFIMPPSLETLRERMTSRGTDSPEVIDRRVDNARAEMAARDRYRHVIVNDNLPDAKAAILEIVARARRDDPAGG
jgi:guanylate kinase